MVTTTQKYCHRLIARDFDFEPWLPPKYGITDVHVDCLVCHAAVLLSYILKSVGTEGW